MQFCSVFLLNAASSNATCKALTCNNFLISCYIQLNLVSTYTPIVNSGKSIAAVCLNEFGL